MRRNFLWAFGGQILFSLAGWCMLISIAKLGSPRMVGQYALGVALTQPVFMLTGLNLRTVTVTDIRRDYRLGHFTALRLLGIAVSLVVIGVLAAAFGGTSETAWVVFLTGFAVAFDNFSDLTYAVFTRWDRLDRQAISLGVRGLLSLALLTAALRWTGSIVYGIAGSALASILVTSLYDIPACRALMRRPERSPETEADVAGPVADGEASWREFLPRWDRAVLVRLFRYALPLGLVLGLVSLNTHVPRYFIQHELGDRALGIFAAMALLVNAGRTAVLSLSYATAKRLAVSYDRGDHRTFLRVLSKMAAISLAVGLPPLALAGLVGKQFLTLMYRPEYAQHTDIFTLILAAGAVGYLGVCLGCAMTAAKVNGLQFAWQAAATFMSGVLCTVLIPRFGLQGAAIAILIAVVFQALSGWWLLERVLRTSVRQTRPEPTTTNVTQGARVTL